MSKKRAQASPPGNARRGMEMLGFLIISTLGIFALGNGLTGLFEVGKSINLLWLAVSVGAMMILGAQMGRVKDTWPKLREAHVAHAQQTSERETAPTPVPSEER